MSDYRVTTIAETMILDVYPYTADSDMRALSKPQEEMAYAVSAE
jgi:hypothetical protein